MIRYVHEVRLTQIDCRLLGMEHEMSKSSNAWERVRDTCILCNIAFSSPSFPDITVLKMLLVPWFWFVLFLSLNELARSPPFLPNTVKNRSTIEKMKQNFPCKHKWTLRFGRKLYSTCSKSSCKPFVKKIRSFFNKFHDKWKPSSFQHAMHLWIGRVQVCTLFLGIFSYYIRIILQIRINCCEFENNFNAKLHTHTLTQQMHSPLVLLPLM